jgi:hypothetical protein
VPSEIENGRDTGKEDQDDIKIGGKRPQPDKAQAKVPAKSAGKNEITSKLSATKKREVKQAQKDMYKA